jgi:hypothetical protein
MTLYMHCLLPTIVTTTEYKEQTIVFENTKQKKNTYTQEKEKWKVNGETRKITIFSIRIHDQIMLEISYQEERGGTGHVARIVETLMHTQF